MLGEKMNRRGGDKILSIYWFAILILVAGGIFGMVYTFYNHPYDVREIEANLLVNHVSDCLSMGGKLNSLVLVEGFSDNFLEMCNVNFNTGDSFEKPQYYLEVNLDGNQIVSEGNKNLISNCGYESEIEKNNLAKCVERSFYSLDENENPILIKILSIIRKTEKNVRQ